MGEAQSTAVVQGESTQSRHVGTHERLGCQAPPRSQLKEQGTVTFTGQSSMVFLGMSKLADKVRNAGQFRVYERLVRAFRLQSGGQWEPYKVSEQRGQD